MESREQLAASRPYTDATPTEVRAAGELRDKTASGEAILVWAMICLLVALAVFFVAFAPGA